MLLSGGSGGGMPLVYYSNVASPLPPHSPPAPSLPLVVVRPGAAGVTGAGDWTAGSRDGTRTGDWVTTGTGHGVRTGTGDEGADVKWGRVRLPPPAYPHASAVDEHPPPPPPPPTLLESGPGGGDSGAADDTDDF